MPVTLENRTRRMQVFHLPHDLCCRDRCTCTKLTAVTAVEHPRTGERALRAHRKSVPGSITFLANERKAGLPSALLGVPEVKAAIDRRDLRIVEQTPDHHAVAAPAAAAAPSAATAPPPAVTAPPPVVTSPPPVASTPAPVAKAASKFVPGTPAVATTPAAKEPS